MSFRITDNNSSVQQIRQIRKYTDSYSERMAEQKLSSGVKKSPTSSVDLRDYDNTRQGYKDSLNIKTLSALRKIETQLNSDIKALDDIYEIANNLKAKSISFLSDERNTNTVKQENVVSSGAKDGEIGVTVEQNLGKTFVSVIEEGSSGQAAGLVVGDQIRFVAGSSVTDDASFQSLIDQYAGQSIDIEIRRERSNLTLNILVDDRTTYTTESIEVVSPSEEVLSFKQEAQLLYGEIKGRLSQVESYGDSFIDKRIDSENLWTNNNYQYKEIVFGFSDSTNNMNKLSVIAENQYVGSYVSNIFDNLKSVEQQGKLTDEATRGIELSVNNILSSKLYLENVSKEIRQRISINQDLHDSRNSPYEEKFDPFNDEIENELFRQRAYEISASLMRASLSDIRKMTDDPALNVLNKDKKSGDLNQTKKGKSIII